MLTLALLTIGNARKNKGKGKEKEMGEKKRR
jgi:hypothetical protein